MLEKMRKGQHDHQGHQYPQSPESHQSSRLTNDSLTYISSRASCDAKKRWRQIKKRGDAQGG